MFWIVQLTAWSSYFVVYFLAVLPYVGTSPHIDTFGTILVQRIAASVYGFLMSSLLMVAYERKTSRQLAMRKLIPLTLVLSWAAGVVTSSMANATRIVVRNQGPLNFRDVFAGSVNLAFLMLAWSACYLCVRYYQNSEKARLLAREAELQRLRYQINPHFLFNSLTSIQALIRESPDRAVEAVDRLSSLLRYSLLDGRAAQVAFSEELAVIENYLNIERMRFEEKLSVQVDVEPAAATFPVPSLLIHPLVENAVKHGMRTSPMPLRIRLKAGVEDGRFRVGVANTGCWIDPGEDAAGVGLENVRRRLEHCYPGAHRFDYRQQDGWVEGVIEIEAS